MLQRTQIILDNQDKLLLHRLANEQKRSLSSLVREMIKNELPKHIQKIKRKKMSGPEFLKKLAENAVSGPGDSEYDKYAYEL